jgi:hypothetical protein
VAGHPPQPARAILRRLLAALQAAASLLQRAQAARRGQAALFALQAELLLSVPA